MFLFMLIVLKLAHSCLCIIMSLSRPGSGHLVNLFLRSVGLAVTQFSVMLLFLLCLSIARI